MASLASNAIDLAAFFEGPPIRGADCIPDYIALAEANDISLGNVTAESATLLEGREDFRLGQGFALDLVGKVETE